MKKLICVMLICTALISCFSIATSAYRIDSHTVKNSQGESLYNIYLWNDQRNDYTLYADLTKYAAADYTFGLVVASISGYHNGEWVDDDWQYQEWDFEQNHLLYAFSTAHFTSGSFCSDDMYTAMIPVEAKGIALVGYNATALDHEYMVRQPSFDENDYNTYFDLADQYTLISEWNFG